MTETVSISLTLEEINLIIGTFEDQEFDRGEDEDGAEIVDDDPAEGSEQAIANSIVDKMESAKKQLA